MANIMELHPAGEPMRIAAVPGYTEVAASIAANGDLVRMWAPEDRVNEIFARRGEPGAASFARTHTDEPYSAMVTIDGAAGRRTRELPLLAATFPMIEALSDGGTLVVAPRCEHLGGGAGEMNARLFCADGSVREFCLGDGIKHVQADGLGRIWVGYSDEGVFGNFGWGIGMGPEPLGSAGLVCYDQFGRATWKFQRPEGLELIADCYALNVFGEEAWACYYTDFPIVRIDAQGQVQGWQSDLHGPKQIAIAGNAALAFGGYGEQRHDCLLLELMVEYAMPVADVKLVLPKSVDLERAEVVGRGARLYVLAEDAVFTFAVPAV